MSKIQHRTHVESLLNKMPKSYISEIQKEIQQIHDKMKDHIGDHFFQIYHSSIAAIAGKLKNKLSREYIDLFEKDYSNYGPQQYNPYGEDPGIAIQRTQQRIERAWKAVQAQMMLVRSRFENEKMIFLRDIAAAATETAAAAEAETLKSVFAAEAAKSEAATIARLGIPVDRTALRAFATSIPKVRQVANRIPSEYGSYKPRDGTVLRNAVAQLIVLIRTIAPNY